MVLIGERQKKVSNILVVVNLVNLVKPSFEQSLNRNKKIVCSANVVSDMKSLDITNFVENNISRSC